MKLPTRDELNAIEPDDRDGMRRIAARMRPPPPRAGHAIEIAVGVSLEFDYKQVDAAADRLDMLRRVHLFWDPDLVAYTRAHYCGFSVNPPPAVAHLDPPAYGEAVHWVAVNSDRGDPAECVESVAHELIHARQREVRGEKGYSDWVKEQRELHPEQSPGDEAYRRQAHEVEARELAPLLAQAFPKMVVLRRVD